MGGKSDQVEKQDMALRLIGAAVAFGVGYAVRKSRSAVGVPVLPLGVAVEVDAIVQVRA